MTDFEKVSMEEVRVRVQRKSKTTPLREEILSMKPGDAISVSFYNSETGEGYKPTTIAQVVSQMTKHSPELRYSMRKDASGLSCFVMCIEKTPEDALRPRRGRKPKNLEVAS
jgi:hypothetical protein